MRRINISEPVLRGLMLAAGLILTCLVIAQGTNMYKQSKKQNNVVIDTISKTTLELMENDITQYDGLMVTGSDVINFYKKHLGEFNLNETSDMVVKITNENGTYTYTNGTYITNLRTSTDPRYIKPTSKYLGTVTKNKNNIIEAIAFELQS